MTVRLSGYDRKKLAEAIKTDIDAYCVQLYSEALPRKHLGVSTIGENCDRQLVYTHRWMHREQFSGRMLRLFNRGHREEERFVGWLKGIGAEVWETDANGKQWRMSYLSEHYSGSLDGILRLPPRYNLTIPFLLEMKTHNEKSFAKLVKSGVRLSKPKHFIQMCGYGESYKFNYGIYIAINKNDDEVYVEVVELDKTVGKQKLAKAGAVIGARTLPPRVAASPAFETCKFCPMSGICHNNEPIDVNCRSCRFSEPVENGQWKCNFWNGVIPEDYIPQACNQWIAFE